jgi:hypothetical protein
VIRFIFRWAFRLLLLAIVLVAALVLLKDTLARNYAEAQIRRETGFDAKIGRLEFSLFEPTLTIENFVLYNPADFGGSPCLEMPELHIEYNRDELAFRRFHIKLLRLNIRELNIVLDRQGRTNIVELLRKAAGDEASSRRTNEYTFTGADMLNLSVGTIRYTNLRFPARNQEIHLGLRNETVPNVRSQDDLAGILFKVLLRAGVTIYLDQKSPPARTHL